MQSASGFISYHLPILFRPSWHNRRPTFPREKERKEEGDLIFTRFPLNLWSNNQLFLFFRKPSIVLVRLQKKWYDWSRRDSRVREKFNKSLCIISHLEKDWWARKRLCYLSAIMRKRRLWQSSELRHSLSLASISESWFEALDWVDSRLSQFPQILTSSISDHLLRECHTELALYTKAGGSWAVSAELLSWCTNMAFCLSRAESIIYISS